jgi:transmembrane sensor
VSHRKHNDAHARPAAEAAARWYLRLQEDSVDEQTFIDWQHWLTAHAENREAYDRIEDVVLRMRQAPALPSLPSREELLSDTYDASMPVQEWRERRDEEASAAAKITIPPPDRRTSRWQHLRGVPRKIAAALAATAVIAALIVAGFQVNRSRQPLSGTFTYTTQPGGREAVTLTDGSKVILDADSLLEVQLSEHRRALRLVRGEAYFEVAKDRMRPFVVRAGSTVVTAVGTAFNVRRSENRTVVAVTEGRVEVVAAPEAPRLTAQVAAGEAVSYLDEGNLQSISAAEAQLATAWLNGRRQYRNEPLRYVLADVDRYTGQKIEIADDATGDLRFTGTLNLEHSAGWLRGLSIALPVNVIERKDGTVRVEAADPR